MRKRKKGARKNPGKAKKEPLDSLMSKEADESPQKKSSFFAHFPARKRVSVNSICFVVVILFLSHLKKLMVWRFHYTSLCSLNSEVSFQSDSLYFSKWRIIGTSNRSVKPRTPPLKSTIGCQIQPYFLEIPLTFFKISKKNPPIKPLSPVLQNFFKNAIGIP